VKLANFVLDETRRRVQNQTCGHRGRKTDPLYRIRKLMTIAHERLDADNDAKLRGAARGRRSGRSGSHRPARQRSRA
jgi:hypothetical protein